MFSPEVLVQSNPGTKLMGKDPTTEGLVTNCRTVALPSLKQLAASRAGQILRD